MTILTEFSTPANLTDSHAQAWSSDVKETFAAFAGRFPQFYDPTQSDTPEDATVATVIWPAFPGNLRGGFRQRLEQADAERDVQSEYCEWGVEKNGAGKITRVTFTTEVPEYWRHLFERDRDGLLALYEQLVGEEPDPARLTDERGSYLAANEWNNSTTGRPAHLMQESNSLVAAVRLAAEATILREDNGVPVTGNEELVACGGLGDPARNSDPSIAATVNNAAASGNEITLNNPPGLYIDGLITGGMATPDDADPSAFWTVERGDAAHTVRAVYEVPEDQGRDYVVGDVTIDGQPIEFGAQLAIRVRVRVEAVVKPGNHRPQPQPCIS
jgi:hypothetical protein